MRTQLRIVSLLVALASGTALPALAQTAGGKAIVPPFDSRYQSSAQYLADSFFITNITSNPITVSLSIYTQTGSLVTANVTVVSGNGAGVSGFALNSAGSTAVFTLAANATTQLSYNNTSLDCSSAIIAWSQSNSRELYGLIADVKENFINSGADSFRTIAVNNNNPF
jgi:hypothetical protein